jgi:hypothetical protein
VENIYPILFQQSYQARKTLDWGLGRRRRSIQAVPRHMEGLELAGQIMGRTDCANDTSDTVSIKIL